MSDKKGKRGSIERTYQKKTALEHILLRPDTYIGSVEHDSRELWAYDSVADEIVFKQVSFVPGLYKIFGKYFIVFSDVIFQMRSWSMPPTTTIGTTR